MNLLVSLGWKNTRHLIPSSTTVDGRNPAPDTVVYLIIHKDIYIYTYIQMVVWDFFHQQYVIDSLISFGEFVCPCLSPCLTRGFEVWFGSGMIAEADSAGMFAY